jgi:hypothetical protein
VNNASDDTINVTYLSESSKPQVISITQKSLTERYFDFAFAGRPMQCTPELCDLLPQMFRFEGKMTFEEANQYRYILDVDGNGELLSFLEILIDFDYDFGNRLVGKVQEIDED